MLVKKICTLSFASLFMFAVSSVNVAAEEKQEEYEMLHAELENLATESEDIREAIDDIQWFNKLGDIAYVDKVWQYSTPAKENGNALKFHSHVFIPKNRKSEKVPLMIVAHGGINGAFQTKYAHILRELVTQGYAVIAPEYRGSKGFGEKFKRAMDKGGKELDDIHMARNFMLETFPFVDNARVGIMGWSFGGFIAAMSPMIYPEDYQAAFSGNPVSNLAYRMTYKKAEYRAIFESKNLIGKSALEDRQAYIDRSPVGHVDKLKTPLLIHTTSSDKVVRLEEIQTLVDALETAGKNVQYKVYENAPGDHSFERLHTGLARKARLEMYAFLNGILVPDNPFKSESDLVDSWILK